MPITTGQENDGNSRSNKRFNRIAIDLRNSPFPIIQMTQSVFESGKKKRPEGRIKTDEKDNPRSRGEMDSISYARPVRAHWLEQYLSGNRMNRRSQMSLKTVYIWVNPRKPAVHRRSGATID
ncbi:hypothetical protein [Paraburkholderia diazotrophica]|uniref:hypothetical protein n=1 Tax=Paraburkholderia diazotrophica TaxID=667676 RepID=UPI003180552B